MSKALVLTGGSQATQTAKFCQIFDTFFDILNVSNFTNGTRNRKPNQYPFRHAEDKRLAVSGCMNHSAYNNIISSVQSHYNYCLALQLRTPIMQWLEDEFLGYLSEWEEAVEKRTGFEPHERKRMLLSSETHLGLRITGSYGILTATCIIPVSFLYSELTSWHCSCHVLHERSERSKTCLQLCQDPIENFFDCQRQRGGTSDNPNVKEFYDNTETIRYINSPLKEIVEVVMNQSLMQKMHLYQRGKEK